jgi:hypothetical protein
VAWTFHTISWDLVGTVWAGSTRSVQGMQQVQSLRACFGYRWDACEHWLFLATGVNPMRLRPLITVGNLGAWSCLDIV